jgi:hypothetical protein
METQFDAPFVDKVKGGPRENCPYECARIVSLEAEVARLERRFLEETAAHDKTRHRLECRERELERIRSNMYSERVERMRDAP